NLMRGTQWIKLSFSQRCGAGDGIGGFHSCEKIVERRTQSVDVAARTRAQILNLFRRRVTPRETKNASARIERRLGHVRRGQAEVQQSNLPARSDLQVMRFYIAVDDLMFRRMKIDEGVQNLIGPRDHFRSRKRPALPRNDLR